MSALFSVGTAIGIVVFSTTASAAEPDAKEIATAVQAYFDAYNARDLKALAACLAKDFAILGEPTPAAHLNASEEKWKAFESTQYQSEVVRMRVEGKAVVARVKLSGTITKKGAKEKEVVNDILAITFVQQEGRWKWQKLGPISEDFLLQVLGAKSKEERKALFQAETDDFIVQKLILKLHDTQRELMKSGQFEMCSRCEGIVLEAAANLREAGLRNHVQNRCLLMHGELLEARSLLEEAAAFYQRLATMYRASGEWKEEFSAYFYLASVQNQLGDYNAALATNSELEKFRDRLNAKENHLIKEAIYSEMLLTMGRTQMQIGNGTAAMKHFEEAMQYAISTENPSAIRRVKAEFADLEFHRSHYREAIRGWKSLYDEAGQTGDTHDRKLGLNIGLAFAIIGEFAEAEKYLRESLVLAKATGDRLHEAKSLQNLASLHDLTDSPEEAERCSLQAIGIYRAIGYTIGLVEAVMHLGKKQTDAGRYREARRTYDEIIPILKSKEIGGTRFTAQMALVVAFARADQRQMAEAEEAFNFAIDSYRRLQDKSGELRTRLERWVYLEREKQFPQEFPILAREIAKFNDPLLNLLLQIVSGRIAFDQKQWKLAVEAFKAQADLVARLESTTPDPLQKATAGQQMARDLYALWTAALAEQGEYAEAYRVAERGKSRSLRQMLDRSQTPIQKEMNAADRKEETRLRDAVAAARKLAVAASQFSSTAQSRERVYHQMDEAEHNYDAFRRKLYADHPEMQFRQGASEPTELPELQRTLFASDPGLIIVSYLVAHDRVIVMILTAADKPDGPAKVRFETVRVSRTELAEAVNALVIGCQSPTGNPVAKSLWEWLIDPVEKDLAGKKHLVIIPGEQLLNCPFQAIRKDGEKETPFLLETIEISYAPSISTLVQLRHQADARRQGRTEKLETMLAVGGIQFGAELNPLKFSGLEADAVSGLFQAKPLLAKQATRSEVLQRMRSARYLHFATHGLPNSTRPLFSALAVTADGDDGRLYGYDIMNLELNADLTVLSACKSALGRDYVGEGTVGLAWAFFVAGSNSVMVTQWSVADDTTAKLMIDFYKRMNLESVTDRAAALQKAQIAFLKNRDTRHPFYWAPFVFIGDWRK